MHTQRSKDNFLRVYSLLPLSVSWGLTLGHLVWHLDLLSYLTGLVKFSFTFISLLYVCVPAVEGTWGPGDSLGSQVSLCPTGSGVSDLEASALLCHLASA